jgi:ATP-dependent Clp protease ATP-binding subunit ClpC
MDDTPLPLSPGVQGFLKAMRDAHPGDRPPGATEWLVLLLQRYGPLVESLSPGFEAARDVKDLRAAVLRGEGGIALAEADLLAKAAEQAKKRGRPDIGERDIAAAILVAAVKPVVDLREHPFPKPGPLKGGSAADQAAPQSPSHTVRKPTPTLEQFGRDLTAAAARKELPTILGREEEIDLVIETLCRRVKRNPLLVGPAGTGKTAIVEGLAQRVTAGNVPAPLKGVRIISLQPSSIVAGGSLVGEIEKRMQNILKEASQPGIVLFIDEVHAIVGAGGREGTGDFASQLKPALARGDFACIAATTDDEFRRFIEEDRALERRFQPIRIRELTPDQTLIILRSIRDEAIRLHNITVPDAVLEWLVTTAASYMPNRRFPDKAVDLLDQSVAYARRKELTEVGLLDAEQVVQRILGIPLRERERVEDLAEVLPQRGLLNPEESEKLAARLGVTTHGFDINTSRPNAVMLMRGAATDRAMDLARTMASMVYGGEERVIRIDFGRLTSQWDAKTLLGTSAGYVGYEDRHELDQVIEMPWSVVVCERIDECHSAVLSAFAPAITNGVVTDMRGRNIYFSDTILVLTVQSLDGDSRPVVGFGATGRTSDGGSRDDVGLGGRIMEAIDVVVESATIIPKDSGQWITTRLLPALAAPLARRGVELVWDPSIVEWLHDRWSKHPEPSAIERFAEDEISPVLVRELQERRRTASGDRYRVRLHNDSVLVEAIPPGAP